MSPQTVKIEDIRRDRENVLEHMEAVQRNGGDISNQRLAVILSDLYVELHGEITEHKMKLDQLNNLVNSKLEKEGTAVRDVKIRLDCQSSLIKEC